MEVEYIQRDDEKTNLIFRVEKWVQNRIKRELKPSVIADKDMTWLPYADKKPVYKSSAGFIYIVDHVGHLHPVLQEDCEVKKIEGSEQI